MRAEPPFGFVSVRWQTGQIREQVLIVSMSYRSQTVGFRRRCRKDKFEDGDEDDKGENESNEEVNAIRKMENGKW